MEEGGGEGPGGMEGVGVCHPASLSGFEGTFSGFKEGVKLLCRGSWRGKSIALPLVDWLDYTAFLLANFLKQVSYHFFLIPWRG
jgi:hypothetical protein